MNILLIRKSAILKNIEFENIGIKNAKRNENFQLGRFIVNFGAKYFYDIAEPEIILQGKKPVIKNDLFYFSISHSGDIVAVAFDTHNTGLDVEEMKPRNFKKIAKYLHINVETKRDFYQYWTGFEAQYKSEKQKLQSFIMGNYMFSVSSFGDIKSKLKIYELVIPKNKIKPSELINLKLVNDNSKNENAVEMQEINIASLEFLVPLSLNIA